MIRSFFFQVIDAVRVAIPGADPWGSLLLFAAASALMVWRLGVLERKGFEGTVLGTLIMPYCSGLPNLVFAAVMARNGGSGAMVLENCLVNNATNMTLLLGLPALLWPLVIVPGRNGKKSADPMRRIDRLSLVMTLTAMIFFSGTLWVQGMDGRIDFHDGLVLVGLFLFWQLMHVIEVLKANVRRRQPMPGTLFIDLLLIMAAGVGTYISIHRLVGWVAVSGNGWLVFDNLGWLSGLLMVLPNAFLALYYAGSHRAEVVVSSQVGDAHICIPMCVGLFALSAPITPMPYFQLGLAVVTGAAVFHLLMVTTIGRLPRSAGVLLVILYGVFLWQGVIR